MKNYLMLYCLYDPSGFVGYHKWEFQASDKEDAEAKACERLSRSAVRKIEYTIYEVAPKIIVGPKLYTK